MPSEDEYSTSELQPSSLTVDSHRVTGTAGTSKDQSQIIRLEACIIFALLTLLCALAVLVKSAIPPLAFGFNCVSLIVPCLLAAYNAEQQRLTTVRIAFVLLVSVIVSWLIYSSLPLKYENYYYGFWLMAIFSYFSIKSYRDKQFWRYWQSEHAHFPATDKQATHEMLMSNTEWTATDMQRWLSQVRTVNLDEAAANYWWWELRNSHWRTPPALFRPLLAMDFLLSEPDQGEGCFGMCLGITILGCIVENRFYARFWECVMIGFISFVALCNIATWTLILFWRAFHGRPLSER